MNIKTQRLTIAGLCLALCLPRHKLLSLYIALISAMIAGRLVWGAVKAFLLGLGGSAFTLKMFMAGALFDAIPGIILHLALIPLLVYGLEIKK